LCILLLLSDNEENLLNKHFTFERMGNLPALLPNATPLVSRFSAEMSKKRQQCAVINLENHLSISAKFTDVYCNCKRQLFPVAARDSLRREGSVTCIHMR
jgi:hypothetical protein